MKIAAEQSLLLTVAGKRSARDPTESVAMRVRIRNPNCRAALRVLGFPLR